MKRFHEKYLNKRYSSKNSPWFSRDFDKLPGRIRRLNILQKIVDKADRRRDVRVVLAALEMAAKEMGGWYEEEKSGKKADAQIKKLISKMKKPSKIKARKA